MNTTPETQVVSVPDGSIYDHIDGKIRKDTPEDTVENVSIQFFSHLVVFKLFRHNIS